MGTTSVLERLLSSAKELSRQHWRQAVGMDHDLLPALQGLVEVACDPCFDAEHCEQLIQEFGIRGLLVLQSAITPLRYVAHPSLDRISREPKLETQHSSVIKRWFTESDDVLGQHFGRTISSTVLLARGLSPVLALDWLTSCCREVLRFASGRIGVMLGEGIATGPTTASAESSFLETIGLEQLKTGVKYDKAQVASVARCYALSIPDDLRIVVPTSTHVSETRATAHELGHALYFKEARGAGQLPWAFEPSAAPEGIAFSLEYWAALLSSEHRGVALFSDISYDLSKVLEMAVSELSYHLPDRDVCDVPRARSMIVQNPWSVLDYALGRLTGFVAVIALVQLGPKRAATQLLECFARPGGAQTWAERFTRLLDSLGLEIPEVRPPIAY